jgi:hypothetical protein
MFNIPTLKSAMAEVGLTTTEGETMNARDMQAFYDFAQRFFGLTKVQAAYGLAYPSTVTSRLPGHPDNEPKDAVEALMPPVVFPPPTPKPVIPNINDQANPESTPSETVDVPGDLPNESDEEDRQEEHQEEQEPEVEVAEQE